MKMQNLIIFSQKSFVEHFYQPEYLFIEMSRVLKENGFLITLTPDWEDNFKMFYDDFTHKRPFTITSLKISIKFVALR